MYHMCFTALLSIEQVGALYFLFDFLLNHYCRISQIGCHRIALIQLNTIMSTREGGSLFDAAVWKRPLFMDACVQRQL